MSIKAFKLFTNIIFIIFCILNKIQFAYSECFLRLIEEPFLRPDFLLQIGSHKVKLELNDVDTGIKLENDQEMEAYCKTNFKSPYYYNTRNTLSLKCENGNTYVNGNSYRDSYFMCSSLKWKLYETSHNFVWCPVNVTSYLLARPKGSSQRDYEYLGGICYDTYKLSFKSLYYTIAPNTKNMHPIALESPYKPSLEVKYLKETFTPKSINAGEFNKPAIRDWINYAHYNYNSIAQNSILYTQFDNQFGSLLDFPWWSSLRLGNWKRYENALTKHIDNQNLSYDVLAGVSSVASAPIIKSCESDYTFSELIDNKKREIPMYVWNYLRSTSNSSDEIVIIGFNSPFYEFYLENEIVFCQDKCESISWLKNVQSTFRYRALGVIFCCTVDEVKSSKRLDGFPQGENDSKPIIAETTTYTNDEYNEHESYYE